MSSRPTTAILLVAIIVIIKSVIGHVPAPCLKAHRTPKELPKPMRNFWWRDPCGEAIFKMVAKDRPEASEYYDADALEQHLAPFKEAGPSAGFLAPHSKLMEYVFRKPGATSVGYPVGQFVTTVKDLKAIIEWAKQQDCKENCEKLKAQKQMNLVEGALGIPKGTWANQHMILVVFDGTEIAKAVHKLRMPGGKEHGANGLWVPGGFLPDGYHTRQKQDALKEALVDALTVATATFYSVYTYDDGSKSWKWEDANTNWEAPLTAEKIEEQNGEVLRIAKVAETSLEEDHAEQYRRSSVVFVGNLARSEYYNFYGSKDLERTGVYKRKTEEKIRKARSGSYGMDGDYGLHDKSRMVYGDNRYRMDNDKNDDEFWLVFGFSILFTGLLIIICCVVLFVCGALIGWKGNQLSNNKMEFQREDSLSDA